MSSTVIRCLAATILLTAISSREAAACRCLPPPPPAEALEKSAAVFLGKVIKIEDGEGPHQRFVTIEVERSWKGGESPTIVVSTSKSSASCGYSFAEGGRYLVYASSREEDKVPVLHASLCSRTRTAEQAETDGDLKELGDGAAPAAE